MGGLFKKYCLFTDTGMRFIPRMLSTYTKSFALAGQSNCNGTLIKVLYSGQAKTSSMFEPLNKTIIKSNINSLFIWTTPTTRLNGNYGKLIYPGHNFSSVTDEKGETICWMSKNPDTKAIIGQRKRAPDPRFKDQSLTMNVFRPYFTSIKEEIEKWEKRASVVPDYPLYVHVIPLRPKIELDIMTYTNNVKQIVELAEPYTLHSWIHPSFEHYFPASNCNSAVEESIFGKSSITVQDMFCQEAVMKIISRFVKNKARYMEEAEALGLTKEIEPSEIAEELYRPLFTC